MAFFFEFCRAPFLLLQALLLLLLLLLLLFCLLFLSPLKLEDHDMITHLTSSLPLNIIKLSNHTVISSSPVVQISSAIEIVKTSMYRKTKQQKANTIRKKISSLDKIEEDLRKARAGIRKAVKSRNYTSDKRETFIPRGSVYRNAYAFHQSHIEMVKRFKVWTYKEGDQPLVHGGPLNYIYAIEGHLIEEIEHNTRSPFKATHPEEAHAFLLPFSVANVVNYVYLPITSSTDYYRDRLQRFSMDYISVIARKYPFWNRSHGADHFMLSCHDWAPEVSDSDPELFKNLIRVLCNANTSEGFRPNRDVPLPELYLPFGKLGPPFMGQAPKNRPILAFFAGKLHGQIRKILLHHWKDRDNEVQVHELLPLGQDYNKLLGRSKFCLCPSGFEVASPRLVEAIYAGCIPVIISEHYVLPFSDILDWSKFSVNIPVEKIPKIKQILRGMSEEEYLQLYTSVCKVRRHFLLNRPAKPFDITHMVLHSLWLRRINLGLTT